MSIVLRASARIVTLFLLFAVAALGRAAGPDFLVDAAWLEGRLKDPKTVVLEVRYHPHRYETVGHIPGAVQVARFADLGDNDHAVIMRLPSRAAFQATLRRWGVDDDSTIVLYDDSRSALAARLYFLLAYYGYDMRRVKILDGGAVEWTAFNELSKEPVQRKPGKVTLKAGNRAMIVEWPEVYQRVVARRDPKTILIDARPKEMYRGTVIRHAVQGGHIPGAINVVSLEGTDPQSQKWLSLEEIAALYKDVPKDATIITYCHDGFRSALA